MSNGYLATHVLDIYNGTPGKGIKGSIFIIENQKNNKIKDFELNQDGRLESPILEKETFKKGVSYRLESIFEYSRSLFNTSSNEGIYILKYNPDLTLTRIK